MNNPGELGQISLPKILEFKKKVPWGRPKKSFSEIDVGLNNNTMSQQEGRIALAQGYIDHDKFIDVAVINQKRDKFAVLFYDPINAVFDLSDYFMVDSAQETSVITSIIIMKDSSELQSFMIVYKKEAASKTSFLKFFIQSERGVFNETNSTLSNFELFRNTQPMLIDIDGDERTDMLLQS